MAQAAMDAVEFDETDLELLETIEADYDVSLDTLASELGLSKSAIHYRLNKLKENGGTARVGVASISWSSNTALMAS